MAALTFDEGLAQVRAWCQQQAPEAMPIGPFVELEDTSVLWPHSYQDEAGRWQWEIVHEGPVTNRNWSAVYPLDWPERKT
jgi:hypothetical protein